MDWSLEEIFIFVENSHGISRVIARHSPPCRHAARMRFLLSRLSLYSYQEVGLDKETDQSLDRGLRASQKVDLDMATDQSCD